MTPPMLLIAAALAAAGAPSGAAAAKFTAMDYIAIQQLYANYAHALDTGQGDRFARTFVVDGEFTGGRAAGHAQDVRVPRKGTADLTTMASVGGTRHFVSNLVITPTASGADGSAYLLLFNARAVPATMIETAIYQDTLVKTAGGWKFKKRIVWRDDDDISPFKPAPMPSPAPASPATPPERPQ